MKLLSQKSYEVADSLPWSIGACIPVPELSSRCKLYATKSDPAPQISSRDSRPKRQRLHAEPTPAPAMCTQTMPIEQSDHCGQCSRLSPSTLQQSGAKSARKSPVDWTSNTFAQLSCSSPSPKQNCKRPPALFLPPRLSEAIEGKGRLRSVRIYQS